MASKQLGKLRQWAGEVIAVRDKTTYSDEFKDVEKDIELRQTGADKLLAASESYHHALTKKRDSDALDDPEKLLPIDALGIVMIVHGEEFPEDSVYGSSLLRLGRAHCKVATLQEAYALDFQGTFLASIRRFQDGVKEYEAHKKKLESRRLSYDAAVAKAEKMKHKKEKDKLEAEEDMEVAKQRYEETLEDVRAKMTAIQESEIELQKDLTGFLELEYNFVEQYLAVLQDVRDEWPTPFGSHKRSASIKHPVSKTNSVRSKRSTKSARSSTVRSNHASGGSEDESPHLPPALSRRSSTHGRSDSISSSKPPSRPTSRLSRKRSDSTATANGEKEKPDKSPKKMSISGWSGWGKKTKDKDFSTLDDIEASHADVDGADGGRRVHRTASSSSMARRMSKRSKDSLTSVSPKVGSRILKPPSQQDKKIVRALYDFNGSSDELSFKVGDEIIILNEVTDDWWMGEVAGRKGLFPTSYTVAAPSPKVSNLLQRSVVQRSPKTKRLSVSSDEAAGQQPLINDAAEASELDEEENFLSGNPLAPNASPFYLPHNDSFVSEDDDSHYPSSQWKHNHTNGSQSDPSLLATPSISNRVLSDIAAPSNHPPLPRRSTTSDAIAAKKVPPPPPPRRSSQNLLNSAAPPIPDRRPNSALGLPGSTTASLAPSSHSSLGYDVSPFESTNELAGCTQFKQHPFKATGMCSNCFQFHHDM